MSNTTALVNGESYSWSQVTINLLGRSIEGVSSIEYETTQEKTNNYGRGVKPVSRGRGKKSYTGSVTLKEEEIRAIEAALPINKSLVDIAAFPIVVVFNNNGILNTDTLMYCEFTNRGVSVNTDSTDVERQINLIIGDIVST